VARPIWFLVPTRAAKHFGGIGVQWTMRGNGWSVARPLMPGILAFAIMQWLATLLSIPICNWGRPASWAWLFVDLVSPPAVLLFYFLAQRGYHAPDFKGRVMPQSLRRVMRVFSIMSAVVGLAPWIRWFNLSTKVAGSAVPEWAQTLTPLTAHVVGGWYLTAATRSATLSRRHTPQAVQVALIAVMAATGLILIGAIWRHATFAGPTISVCFDVLNAAATFTFCLYSRARTKVAVPIAAAAT